MENKNILGDDFLPDYTPTSDEKTLGLLAHILTIVSSFIAPIIIYLLKKDESDFVAAHAKESLNFQITMFILCAISFMLIFIIIGILMLVLLAFVNMILVIVATIKASEGKLYRYPINFRLIK